MYTISNFMASTAYIDVLSNLPIGICLVDSNHRYREVNSAWAEMLGYTTRDLVNVPFEEVTYPRDRQTDSELSRSLFNGEISSFTIKKRWVRKDRSLLPGIMTAMALSGPDFDKCGVAMIVPDHSQVIDKSYTQEVAHDLRGLLQSTHLAADALTKDLGNPSYLDGILNATEMASALTKNLLTTDLRPYGSCNAHHVLRNCLAITSASLPSTVSLRCSYRGQSSVAIDEASLGTIVLNLLTNARDAVNESGNIEVVCEQHSDYIAIQVIDDGIGMDDRTIENATERHYTTKGELGTGLGLFVADETVRNFGGRLVISSSLGTGTTIECQIPMADQTS